MSHLIFLIVAFAAGFLAAGAVAHNWPDKFAKLLGLEVTLVRKAEKKPEPAPAANT